MKYIKTFEGVKDDLLNGLKSLSDKYNADKEELYKKIKLDIDEYMFDLTDVYSNENTRQINHIKAFYEGTPGSAMASYFLKCKWNDVDEFIETLENVYERIKGQLDVDFHFCEIIVEWDSLPQGNHFGLRRKKAS